jgi:23S rRNA pseudouridine1911/1915/1917 synthase
MPLKAEVQVLYEEGPCLVACKPPGLPTQAPTGIDSLEVRLKAFLAERDHPTHAVYLGVPHRLDRPASGAIVFATRRRAAHKLSRQFEHREIEKIYWACVQGELDPPEGAWEDYLRKVYGKPQAEVVAADHPEARLAKLRYRTLRTSRWGAWLEIVLETGRTHQVRIQAASRGHPLLGDFQYGSKIPFGPQYADERLRAIALHARSLGFSHPLTKQWVTAIAPLPAFWPPED